MYKRNQNKGKLGRILALAMVSMLCLSGCGKTNQGSNLSGIIEQIPDNQDNQNEVQEADENQANEELATPDNDSEEEPQAEEENLEKDTETTNLDKKAVAGIYTKTYEDEYDGEKVTISTYLVLEEDGKGFLVIQDVIPIVWDMEKFTYVSGEKVPLKFENNKAMFDYGNTGEYQVFDKTTEPLPTEILEWIEEARQRDAMIIPAGDKNSFEGIVNLYANAFYYQWDGEKLEENGLDYMAHYVYSDAEAKDYIGYCLCDLNDDGTKELLIKHVYGNPENEANDKMIMEAYSLQNGKPEKIFESWERSRNYLIYEEEGSYLIANEGSASAFTSGWVYYIFDGQKLNVRQSIMFDASFNEEKPWFMGFDDDWDVSNDTPIEESEADRIIDALSSRYQSFTFQNVMDGYVEK